MFRGKRLVMTGIKTYLTDRTGPKLWLALIMLAAFSYFGVTNGWWLAPFWDNGVYARAVTEHLAGGDAYRVEPFPFFPFVYHPYVFASFLGVHSVVPLWPALLVAMLASAVFASRALFRAAGIETREFATALAVTACFVMFGLTSFASGNLVVTLDFLIIGVSLTRLALRGSYFGPAAFALIVLGSLVKPYLLAYLALVLLDRRQLWQGGAVIVVGAALAGILWVSGHWVMPDLMARYLANIADLQTPGRMDLGLTVFALGYALLGSNIAALGLHAVVIGALAIWALQALWRAQDRGTMPAPMILALAWLVLTLINPRMKDYDIGPALLFLAPLLWPVTHRFRAVMTGFMTFLYLPLIIVVGAALMGVRL
jgi:hypothetical protein